MYEDSLTLAVKMNMTEIAINILESSEININKMNIKKSMIIACEQNNIILV
jgi:hypothetical protein